MVAGAGGNKALPSVPLPPPADGGARRAGAARLDGRSAESFRQFCE